MRLEHQEGMLARLLEECFGSLDAPARELLSRRLEWMEVPAGRTLMTQGEPGDSMFLSVSGRLRALVADAHGVPRLVREMGRGQIIGEMALLTGQPRSATVVAVRDSLLVRLAKSTFDELLATSPVVPATLARQLVRRMNSGQEPPTLERPIVIAVVAISEGVDTATFAAQLAEQLRLLEPAGKVRVVDAEAVDAALGEPGIARQSAADPLAQRRVAMLLDRWEADSETLILRADNEATPWSGLCTRHADEVLLLADAARPPALHEIERRFLVPMERPAVAEAAVAETLVLLHDAQTRLPSGTAAWLARRPVTGHLHVRPTLPRDMARLARLQARRAVGLVLGGGGARGFAHLGVLQALEEAGIEVDCVGGTSIGAVMALFAASGQPMARVMDIARRAFAINPTGDINPFPVISVIRGQRLKRALKTGGQELLGGPADAEDLWKPLYCVASNYSNASEVVLQSGPMGRNLLASTAIPGALPPVLMNGELLCDGGTFNNFPVDVMRRMRGVGLVIGVDLSPSKVRKLEVPEIPSAWALAWDRLRPRRLRKYRLPSLTAYLMNVTMLYSQSRRQETRQLCDVYLHPPLERVGMLQWKRFDTIARQGYDHAQQVLASLDAGLKARLGLRVAAAPVPVPVSVSASSSVSAPELSTAK